MPANSFIVICHLALTYVVSVLGCHASSTPISSNSIKRIRSYMQIENDCCKSGINNAHIRPLQVRGGAEADSRRNYDRYDDIPRRRPPIPPEESGGRVMRGDEPEYRNERGQRPSRDYESRRYESRYDDERRIRRDDGRRADDIDQRSNYRSESNARNTTPSSEKKKSWFSSKKNQKLNKKEPQKQQQQQPPPPPPPPNAFEDYNPAESERLPINYMFPTAEVAASERTRDEKTNDVDPLGGPDLPVEDANDQYTTSDTSRERRRRRSDNGDRYASPRRDAVTIYMSTRMGAAKVRLGSIVVGAALGSFIGKSLMNDAVKMSVIMAGLLFFAGFLRNDYGELSRALGLALLMTLQRTKSVRKEYPTMVHLKAMIRQGPRTPFPPVEEGSSPWRYEPVYEDDPEFKMTYALLAMALVGSFCGGNVPLLPQWMGGVIGALLFASLTSGSNARGDLGRTMGMRVVGLLQLVLKINTELRILGKAATVGGLIFDKLMIMDRKHRIKDKIVAICRWGYDKVSNTAAEMQADLNDDRERERDRGGDRSR
ncbi:hypothetical protein ACHAWO_011590 [Cyclotella atomus]|uniref:Uncharacterized protein n=1 Tax=Cyclotella atomus TaxID=382360 RepID=A0ABD3NWK2_9STRA